MIAWISANLATIIICAVLIAAVALIVLRMVKNHREGKSGCGCGCSSCQMAGSCHNKAQKK